MTRLKGPLPSDTFVNAYWEGYLAVVERQRPLGRKTHPSWTAEPEVEISEEAARQAHAHRAAMERALAAGDRAKATEHLNAAMIYESPPGSIKGVPVR